MITYVRGEVVSVDEKRLVVDVGGIGYQIGITQRDALRMSAEGEQVKIHTYMSVREDAVSLFGFLDPADLDMYRMLISVSGVGPKAGLSILSVLGAAELSYAVLSEDVKAISKAPGIGAKMAKKVILELKDKIDAAKLLHQEQPEVSPNGSEAFRMAKAEAVDVLAALGYSRAEALRTVNGAKLTEDMDTDQILSAALSDGR